MKNKDELWQFLMYLLVITVLAMAFMFVIR